MFLRHTSILILSIIIISCEPREEIINASSALQLHFSTDTVIFDTLFTERTSITKRLKIYNPNKNAIHIANIRLGKGLISDYQLIIYGKQVKTLNNIDLFGKDSLLILVDVLIDPQDENMPYLVKDSIIVNWNSNVGYVQLVSWGQDAYYYQKSTLCDYVFSADRPHVFYDTILINENCQAVIEPGSRLYFNQSAALIVLGSLEAIGDSNHLITFRNVRFDEDYIIAPGQWQGISFYNQGHGIFDYVIVENAVHGITVGTPDSPGKLDVSLSHTTIRHSSQSGIRAFTSDVTATNTLVYNAGHALILNVAGGSYHYEHCTFVNFPNSFITNSPSVIFADFYLLSNNELLIEPIDVTLKNSIVWGLNEQELLDSATLNNSTFLFENNIIKSNKTIKNNITSEILNYPGFSGLQNYDYRLDSLSPAINKSNNEDILNDITGKNRQERADIGAFEYNPL